MLHNHNQEVIILATPAHISLSRTIDSDSNSMFIFDNSITVSFQCLPKCTTVAPNSTNGFLYQNPLLDRGIDFDNSCTLFRSTLNIPRAWLTLSNTVYTILMTVSHFSDQTSTFLGSVYNLYALAFDMYGDMQ